jgi:hypothetical protein
MIGALAPFSYLVDNNVTNEYNYNNWQIEYSLTRLSLFRTSAWDRLYQKTLQLISQPREQLLSYGESDKHSSLPLSVTEKFYSI